MGLFKNKKTNYIQDMREYLREFMRLYIKNNPSVADAVIPIFSNTEVMIRGLTEKKVKKMMNINHVNIECGVLNILQNFSMTEIKAKPAADFMRSVMFGEMDTAYALYNYINDFKFNKGYINKQQYDENSLLATELSIHSPFRH